MAQIEQPIIAVGNDTALVRAWNLLPGTVGVHLPNVNIAADSAGTITLEALWSSGHITQSDVVLVVLATTNDADASLSFLQTVRVGQLAEQQAWPLAESLEAA